MTGGPRSALRRFVGARVHRLLDRAVGARLRLEVEAHVEQEVARALEDRLPAAERRLAAAYSSAALTEPLVFGPPERVRVAETAVINDALLNTTSGSITVDGDAFFGHRVCLLTGTHDVSLRGRERQRAIPADGHDIHIGHGAWIGTGAMVLGPCRIGAHAVVAAGAVVTGDVAAATLVAGVPARVLRSLPEPD